MSPSVGIVILAAGGSSRMGSPKQLVEIEGEPLLVRTVSAAKSADLGPVVVVLGGHADVVRPVLANLGVRVVENPHWDAGMGGSIRMGVAALMAANPELGAIVLAVGDQPGLTAEWYRTLASSLEGHAIAAASYDGVLGTPAIFGQVLFPALLALAPDEGAKRLLRDGRVDVAAVPFAGGALDLDTPEDVARWRASEGANADATATR